MKITAPNKFEMSQAEFDAFKLQAKAEGLNISGVKDAVQVDGVGVNVAYDADGEELTIDVHVPHWAPPYATIGFLYTLIARGVAASEEGLTRNAIRAPQKPDQDTNKVSTTHHKTPGHPAHK